MKLTIVAGTERARCAPDRMNFRRASSKARLPGGPYRCWKISYSPPSDSSPSPARDFAFGTTYKRKAASDFVLKKEVELIWDVMIHRTLFFIRQMNDYWSDLTDISANTKTLKATAACD